MSGYRGSSRYNIKYTESTYGVNWKRKGVVCIDANQEHGETCMSRACVIKEEEIYKMWYCIATIVGGYKKIEYACPKEAYRSLSQYICFYNYERPHQALDYQPPAQVYGACTPRTPGVYSTCQDLTLTNQYTLN
jgi:hypothetical protein